MTRYVEDTARSVWIGLDAYDVARACAVGDEMHDKSCADGRQDAHGFAGDAGRLIHRQGACAELAVAKKLAVWWPGWIDQGDKTDLPFGIEARYLGRPHYGLRVRASDDNLLRVVGAIPPGPANEFVGQWRLPGWCEAGRAQRAEWQMAPNGRPPFWAVPQSSLRPLAELRVAIAAQMLCWAAIEQRRTAAA